ncbi:hypothetical protein D623_10033621 [Myotis brandtii]|uniref:Uncharacterized protein n=1 Tax=Myotis brandtii TaxID=109478 RepID=S7MF20_MYOBR|nr:hypothetical protein D623_10033621 [Myotis brandtii]
MGELQRGSSLAQNLSAYFTGQSHCLKASSQSADANNDSELKRNQEKETDQTLLQPRLLRHYLLIPPPIFRHYLLIPPPLFCPSAATSHRRSHCGSRKLKSPDDNPRPHPCLLPESVHTRPQVPPSFCPSSPLPRPREVAVFPLCAHVHSSRPPSSLRSAESPPP